MIGAAIVAGAGIAAWFLLPREAVEADRCRHVDDYVEHHPCPVDGNAVSVREPVSAGDPRPR